MLVEVPDTYGRHPQRATAKRYTFHLFRAQGRDTVVTVWADDLAEAVDAMLDGERAANRHLGRVVDWTWAATSNDAGSMRVVVKEPVR